MIQALTFGIPHFYTIRLEQFVKSLTDYESLLSSEEKERASRFRFMKDRKCYVVCRASLRYILGYHLKENPSRIRFRYSSHGKPELVATDKAVYFNISHSHQVGMIGINMKTPIGIDVELIQYDDDLAEIAQKFFSRAEVAVFKSLSEEERPQGFFNCWTRKEAFIKAVGHGLSFPLDQFEVSLKPQDDAHLKATHFDPDERQYWHLRTLTTPVGYAAAFAVRQKISDYLESDFNPEWLE